MEDLSFIIAKFSGEVECLTLPLFFLSFTEQESPPQEDDYKLFA
jgi:hypothetical protein